MHTRSIPVVTVAVAVLLGATLLEGATDGPTVALLPTQNRAGDGAAAESVERTLRLALGVRGHVVDAESTRNALRRLRIRNGDRAVPRLMQLLGQELGAAWLVCPTLHEAERRQVPRVTLSVRVYSGETGRLSWAGFEGGSGLDGRTVLGFGVIGQLERLVEVVLQELLRDLPASPGSATEPGDALGTLAIVPFGGHTVRRATADAETVTEATQAVLLREGTRLVSPNESFEILRRLQAGQWGGVAAPTRNALRETGRADAILTGAVETYEEGWAASEPEPRVAVTMRLLDAASGRILWTGEEERTGRDALDLLGLGLVHSRGALTEQIVESLTRRLRREVTPTVRRSQGEP